MISNIFLKTAKKDVITAIEIWKKIIRDFFSDEISFAYIKGSAIKEWDSFLDYVPILSDLDIHLILKNTKSLLPSNEFGFKKSLKVSRIYETLFLEARPDGLHIPRPQIVLVDRTNEFWLPEKNLNVECIYGELKYGKTRDPLDIRKEDLKELLNLNTVLTRLPIRAIDRVGLEYYRIIRELCWIVSPTPSRLLSQMIEPNYVWNLNRTSINKEIKNLGYHKLAESINAYYLSGWKMFESDFKENNVMRKALMNAYNVMYYSYCYSKQGFQNNSGARAHRLVKP